ncbi:hypothetical protein ACFL5Z_01890 [Planctomycetota bacterium]
MPKEPTSPNSQSQSTKNQALTKTSKSTIAPENQKLVSGLFFEGKIDTSELSPDLAEIVTVWPELPEHIKAAIKALIQTHIKEKK